MGLSPRLLQFLEMNTAGRVVLLCRARQIFDADKAAFYTRAVKQAVMVLADESDGAVEVDRLLNEQLAMLDQALGRPPVPRLPPRRAEADEVPAESVEAPPRPRVRSVQMSAAEALSMEQKLQEQRRPVKELLEKDCVRLGLVEKDRAKALIRKLAGRKREEAEKDIVAELRDNLQQQIRAYMRKHKGGPWDSVAKQEDLRLDIVHTHSVHALVTLTRQLLKERKDWEGRTNKGLLRGFWGGRVNASGGDES